MSTSIHKATIDGLDAIAAIFNAYRVFYEAPSNIEQSKTFIMDRLSNNDSIIFCAFSEQKTVTGFTQLYPSYSSVSMRKIWILNDLFVQPDFRNRGIGRALIAKAIEFAKLDGAVRLSLSTAKNNPAQFLYEKTGFRESSFKFYNFSLT